MYALDDEYGNEITTGLASYEAANQVAARYLAAHNDDRDLSWVYAY